MGMVKHKVTIYHVYQDQHNPDKQIVMLDCDYAAVYAFFMALIDSGKNFDVEIKGGED